MPIFENGFVGIEHRFPQVLLQNVFLTLGYKHIFFCTQLFTFWKHPLTIEVIICDALKLFEKYNVLFLWWRMLVRLVLNEPLGWVFKVIDFNL